MVISIASSANKVVPQYEVPASLHFKYPFGKAQISTGNIGAITSSGLQPESNKVPVIAVKDRIFLNNITDNWRVNLRNEDETTKNYFFSSRLNKVCKFAILFRVIVGSYCEMEDNKLSVQN